MSQFRKDIFTGRGVILGETEVVRPGDFRFKQFARATTFCPFCETHEASTPPEIFAVRYSGSAANGPGWKTRVVANSNLRLRIEGDLDRRPEGFHDMMNGIGADEVIAEAPSHNRSLHELGVNEVEDVLRTWVATWREIGAFAMC